MFSINQEHTAAPQRKHLARCKPSGFLALFVFWTEWPAPPLNKNSLTTENEKYQNFAGNIS